MIDKYGNEVKVGTVLVTDDYPSNTITVAKIVNDVLESKEQKFTKPQRKFEPGRYISKEYGPARMTQEALIDSKWGVQGGKRPQQESP